MSSKESTPWEAVVRVSCILAPLLLAGLPSSASGDALDQWHWRNPIPSSVGFEGLAFGRSRFVGVGNGGWILSSTDAKAWSTTYAGFRMSFNNVVSSDHGFLAFGYADGEGVVLTSPDGSRWSHHAVPEAAWMLDAAFADGLFVGVARVHTSNSGPLIATSTDGLRWTTLDLVSLPTVDLRGVAHGNGTWVAVGNNGLILTSPDGIEWSVSDSGTPRDLADIAFGGGRFVAVGHRANVSIALVSSDGLEWTTTLSRTNGSPTSPGNLDLDRVAAGTGGFVAIGAGSSALFSVDGETWTEHPLGQVILRGGVAFGDGRWAAGGFALSESRAFTTALSTSTDGMQWTNRTAGVSSATQNGIAFGDGVYVAVGSDARIARSTNGVDWSLVPHGLLGYDLRRVFHVGGRFLALGSQGNTPSLLVSEQGREWT
ncbi:MAG: hypothetical protein JNL97_05405, partial [Verrucomicrobiales bacterium]|nr:hypothetical protein [Verrucomicrobiales bacterium]